MSTVTAPFLSQFALPKEASVHGRSVARVFGAREGSPPVRVEERGDRRPQRPQTCSAIPRWQFGSASRGPPAARHAGPPQTQFPRDRAPLLNEQLSSNLSAES